MGVSDPAVPRGTRPDTGASGRCAGRSRRRRTRARCAGPNAANSTRTYTAAETRDTFNIADWHPDEHPPMPDVVSHGRRPDVRACGYCHLANGFGKPENAPLAGQPADYIVQQMRDYRDGRRMGSEPRVVGPALMVAIAKAATDDEIRIAAEYFASVRRKPWIRVVEADMVPVTRNTGVMYAVIEGGGTEPIGNRILEVAENYAATELRDGGSGFIAYAPPGSVAKGQALVTTGGNGRTIACGICHGPDMRGLGAVPSIAGRSPSYMARQIYDFKNGTRNGPSATLMTGVVAQLTDEDIVNIFAYLGSLAP
jgi:cytochrome c553